MSHDADDLIHGYFDDTLSKEEQARLCEWIKSAQANARAFAAAAMLHDRLRNISFEGLGNESAFQSDRNEQVQPLSVANSANRTRSVFSWATAVCLLLLGGLFSWHYVGVNSASAAAVELDRLIAANSHPLDRTFSLAVEEIALAKSRRDLSTPENHRPPKPSLDGALLYVRGSNQFVLRRKLDSERCFVTGSNGKSSWAVRPEDPVRVSSDLTRFNHDVPGHEHAMPLNHLHDGLERIHTAYRVTVVSAEPAEESVPNAEPSKLLVAVKKRGFRGPNRVEITYGATSGRIRQMRFVEMPYGPDRLTVRMTLIDEQSLAADFFEHESHHDPERVVEFEE